jgi:hypothetical protein
MKVTVGASDSNQVIYVQCNRMVRLMIRCAAGIEVESTSCGDADRSTVAVEELEVVSSIVPCTEDGASCSLWP